MVTAVASDTCWQLALSGGKVHVLGVAEDHNSASLPCLILDWVGGCGLNRLVGERRSVFCADGAKDGY